MKLKIRETAVFGVLGALMFASKLIMEVLPNVHLLAVFTVAFTVVYRAKALYPIYIYTILCGLYAGFNMWWIPHLYLWTVLWGVTMLLPKRMPPWLCPIVYAVLCSAHGFLYGTLYAPAQALMFGFSFDQTVAWIAAGFPWDVVHGFSNLGLGLLIVPIVTLLRKLEKRK